MNIIITLPSNIEWSEYQKELDLVKDGEHILNFKVNNFPKNTKIGERCYLVHKGYVVGWMHIFGFSKKDFTCSTTNKEYIGKFIERSGHFYKIKPIEMKGFQGFRYYN